MREIKKARLLASVLLACAISIFSPVPSASAIGSDYFSTVAADAPTVVLHLNETSGTTALNSGSGAYNGLYANVTLNQPGGIASNSLDRSVRLPWNGAISVGPWVASTNAFSEEIWFKTTSITGGRLLGFSDESANDDKTLFMDAAGRVRYGLTSGNSLTSPSTYNDGKWHMAAATLGPNGARLYLDGQLVSSNAGLTSSASFSGKPVIGASWIGTWWSTALEANVDEPATWSGVELSASQLLSHYASAGQMTSATASVVVNPTFAFTVTGNVGACNGSPPSAGTSAGAFSVALGHVTAGNNGVASQSIAVSTNSANGYSVNLAGSAPSDGNGHSLGGVPSGTNGSPTSFTIGAGGSFGYTTDSSTLSGGATRFQTNKWASISSTPSEIAHGNGPGGATNCVAFQAGVDAATTAGVYSSVVTYLATPNF